MAPVKLDAKSRARSWPSPKCKQSDCPLLMTEMTSAVLRVAVGDLSLSLPSSVRPERSSRKMVTNRRISSLGTLASANSRALPNWFTLVCTISTSSSRLLGRGNTTVLKRRCKALESSFTPRSRSLAVAMMLKPRVACTSVLSSGMGKVFSERIVIKASCTSDGMRVSSSIRTNWPCCMPCITGLGTKARSEGPSAKRRA